VVASRPYLLPALCSAARRTLPSLVGKMAARGGYVRSLRAAC
jgi:hypothetical protein